MTEQKLLQDDVVIAGPFWIGSDGRPRSVIIADDHYVIPVDCANAGHGQLDQRVSGSASGFLATKPPVRPEPEDLLIDYSPSAMPPRSHSDHRHID